MSYHKIITLLCLLWIIGAPIPSAMAQQQTATRGVELHANVRSDLVTGILCFDYSATNPISNSGVVANISIDVAKQPGGADLSADGVRDGPGADTSFSVTVLQDRNATPMIPVGVSAPSGWDVSLSVQGAAVWLPTDSGLLPGQQLDGLEICARALPGFRSFLARPYTDVNAVGILPPNGTAADLQRYQRDLNTIELNAGTTGLTVGPVAPPATFVPLDFLKQIQDYKEQSLARGWIKNAGIANSLDAKLNAAQLALTRGDANPARNQLNALLNEVDAQSGKQLTSEAGALLKFNTQFLISNIP